MAEGGFDDIEMRDKNFKKEEEEDNEDKDETQFYSPDEDFGVGDPRYGMPKEKINRVEIPDVKKDIGGIKKSMTEDRKRSFKKIFNMDIAKKNGFSSKYLIENTIFQEKEKLLQLYIEEKKLENI